MKGLLDQGMQRMNPVQPPGGAANMPMQQGGAAPALDAKPAMPPAQGTGQAKGLLAGEVNQEEVDIMVANGLKLVHTPKISDALIKAVTKAKDPVKAVADATLNIVARLEQSSEAAGKKLSLTTLAYGANYIMGEIITSAEAAGMKKMDDRTKYRAFSLAVGKYIDNAIKTGKITKEEVLRLGQEAEASPMGQKMSETMQRGGPPSAMEGPGAETEAPMMGGENGRTA